MTNLTIITNSAIEAGLYTEEQVKEIFSKGLMLPLFTFKAWQEQGYQVKKGEHAKLTCYIWKPKGKKKEKVDEEIDETNFFKTKAFFFTPEQVQKIQ